MFRILLGLGSSKPWEDILEEFAGVRTFSAQACLRYFQPSQEYLQELVDQGQLKVGWTCNGKNKARRDHLSPWNIFVVLSFDLIYTIRFILF